MRPEVSYRGDPSKKVAAGVNGRATMTFVTTRTGPNLEGRTVARHGEVDMAVDMSPGMIDPPATSITGTLGELLRQHMASRNGKDLRATDSDRTFGQHRHITVSVDYTRRRDDDLRCQPVFAADNAHPAPSGGHSDPVDARP